MSRPSLVAATVVALLAAAVGVVPSLAQSPAPSIAPIASGAPIPSGSLSPEVSPAASPSAVPGAVTVAASVTVTCRSLATAPEATPAVDAGVGSSVVVRLCSNPTTGFRWSDPASSDPTIVSVGGWTYRAPAAKKPRLAGAPGFEELTLIGLAAGHAVVTASYDQPWEGGQKRAWVLQLDVTVRPPVAVAIDCAAFGAGNAATASVDAPAGSVVVLTVCSDTPTRYRWIRATSSDVAVAVPGNWVDQEPPAIQQPHTGVTGAQVLTIAADATGTAIISADYVRPRNGAKSKPLWTLELTVNVQ